MIIMIISMQILKNKDDDMGMIYKSFINSWIKAFLETLL